MTNVIRGVSPVERDAAIGVIGLALARPDRTLAPVVCTLAMHLWLIDRGMAPGRIVHDDGGCDAAWTVLDEGLALATVHATAWRKVFA